MAAFSQVEPCVWHLCSSTLGEPQHALQDPLFIRGKLGMPGSAVHLQAIVLPW